MLSSLIELGTTAMHRVKSQKSVRSNSVENSFPNCDPISNKDYKIYALVFV